MLSKFLFSNFTKYASFVSKFDFKKNNLYFRNGIDAVWITGGYLLRHDYNLKIYTYSDETYVLEENKVKPGPSMKFKYLLCKFY